VAQREIDRAVDAASTMLDRAEGMESVRLNNRFRAVTDALRPEDAASAREVVERIDTNLTVPI
jgi:hypothetical protein